MQDMEILSIKSRVGDYMKEQAYPEAISLCKEALKELESEPHSPENERNKMKLLFCLSDICHVSGNWVDSLVYLSTVIDRSSRLSEPDIKCEAIVRSGDILSKMAKWDKALERYSQAERLVMRFKNPYLLGRTYIGRGVVLWRQGKYTEAMENAIHGYEIGIDIDNTELKASASSLKASINFDIREYGEAMRENDLALEAYRALKDDIEVARIMNNKGEIFKMLGEYEKAIDIFKGGLDIMVNTMNNRSLGYLYTNLAECQIRLGNHLEAEMTSKLAENAIKLSEDKYIKAQYCMVKGLIELAMGNHARALNHMSDAGTFMSKLDIPYDLGVIQLEHARVLKLADREKAAEQYNNALKSFKKARTLKMMKIAKAELLALD